VVVTFQDFEQLDNPRNGTALSDAASVSDFVGSFHGRDPFVFELCCEEGYRLTNGCGSILACVQYSAADGLPPYMFAVADTPYTAEPKCFFAGGQPTEIPARFCIPIQHMERIVEEFIATGQRSPSVA
jgi:hypothetical protein